MVLSARYVHAILVTFWLLYFCFIHTPIYYLVERSLWLDISKANVQQVRFNYSLKNIGLSTNDGYESEIIDKCQDVIQRIRWKAHFFLHQPNTTIQRSNYGLKSKFCAPFVAELKPFEDDLAKMIEILNLDLSTTISCKNSNAIKEKNKSSANVFVPAGFFVSNHRWI